MSIPGHPSTFGSMFSAFTPVRGMSSVEPLPSLSAFELGNINENNWRNSRIGPTSNYPFTNQVELKNTPYLPPLRFLTSFIDNSVHHHHHPPTHTIDAQSQSQSQQQQQQQPQPQTNNFHYGGAKPNLNPVLKPIFHPISHHNHSSILPPRPPPESTFSKSKLISTLKLNHKPKKNKSKSKTDAPPFDCTHTSRNSPPAQIIIKADNINHEGGTDEQSEDDGNDDDSDSDHLKIKNTENSIRISDLTTPTLNCSPVLNQTQSNFVPVNTQNETASISRYQGEMEMEMCIPISQYFHSSKTRKIQDLVDNAEEIWEKMEREAQIDVIRGKGKRTFWTCPIPQCRRMFNRKEHLKRHFQSHIPKRKYKCSVCQKGFTRSDNLREHGRVHERKLLQKKIITQQIM